MKSRLKEQVAAGTGWTMGEKIATALFQLVVRILVLRLLLPEDLKVVALLLAFASVALVVADSGFSQMLVRKAAPDKADYLGVFRYNVVASLLLYLVLTATAPAVARYYDTPELATLAPLFYLMVPLHALCVLQQTICVRRFRFARLSKITFAAQVVSGTAAVAAAYAGWGVWALVWQQVLMTGTRAVLLWRFSSWRPRPTTGSAAALRAMAPYSMSLLLSDLVAALYAKLPHLFIGKLYPDATLGYYDQANKLKELPPVAVYAPEYVKRPPKVDVSEPLEITVEDGVYLVEGPWLQRLISNTNFGDYESRNWFDKMLRESGLFDRLEAMGIRDGDLVSMYDLEFEYQR